MTRQATGPARERRLVLEIVARAWAAPYTAIGLGLGLCVLLLGGRMELRQGALEFGGGRLGRLMQAAGCPFCAITLGHVILGTDPASLAAVRAHEQVHVRQYERWGILFGPAYALSSAMQFVLGRRPYLDNVFEREARASAEETAPADPPATAVPGKR